MDCSVLEWTRVDCSGLELTRVDCSGLEWTRVDCSGLVDWTGLDYTVFVIARRPTTI